MIVYLATRDELAVHAGYLATWGRSVAPSIRLMSYEELFARRRLPEATWVFADLERLSVADREQAAAVWRRLARDQPHRRRLNHPLRSRRRYSLLRALHEGGINDFDVFRVEEPRRPSRYPVFLRCEADHQGALTGLLESADAVDREVEALLERGVAADELLIVEFSASPDHGGQYRKYSTFRIGDRLVPGHLFAGEEWVVKGPDIIDAEIVAAELDFVERFDHEEALARVFDIAEIEFGRVDYDVTEMGLRVFEINTHPTIMGPDDNFAAERQAARQRSADDIASALRALDDGPSRRSTPAPRGAEWRLIQIGPRFALIHRTLARIGADRWAPALHLRSTRWLRALRRRTRRR